MKLRLTWVNRRELQETGVTQVWRPPHRLPDDEVTFGEWVEVRLFRGKPTIVETTND